MNEYVDNRFDSIRPYYDEEVSGVIRKLLNDREFIRLIGRFRLPLLTRFLPFIADSLIRSTLKKQLEGVGNIREWQEVAAEYARKLIDTSMDDLVFENIENLDTDKPYLFVSNHRDIAGDSMLVNYGLYINGGKTVRIAVGDNLVQKEFATDLMRLNKSFFIQRSVEGVKNLLRALTLSSEYIHFSIQEGESVWIAQREGRSKDGIDLTDPAIIKMFALAKRKEPFPEVIRSLNIVPVSVSYEYDPCDLLKARELSIRDTCGSYSKPEGEDLLSLVKGLSGYKGRVNVSFGELLDGNYESPEAVVREIDRQILGNYKLFPVNYYALSLFNQEKFGQLALKYPGEFPSEKSNLYLDQRIEESPSAHRNRLVEMYANPVLSVYKSRFSA